MAIRRHQAQTGATTVRRVRRRPDRVTTAQPPDIFHVARDEEYIRQLRQEAEHWDSRPETLLSKFDIPADKRPVFNMVQRYQNERLTGDPNRWWFEVVSDYGEFRRGCVLGAGPGEIESRLLRQHDQLQLTIYDISGDSLARLQDRLEKEFPGRTETRREDLNFVTLPADRYDLLVADSCIHHIVNLEHLAFQINQCLTPAGHFFMKDAVGESYFQFSEEKKRLFEAFTRATKDSSGSNSRIQWPDREQWIYSPYESVRSGEILEVFRRYLSELQVNVSSSMLELSLFAGSAPSRARMGIYRIPGMGRAASAGRALRARLLGRNANSAQAMARCELLLLLDNILSDTGYLKPGVAFAIYQKRH